MLEDESQAGNVWGYPSEEEYDSFPDPVNDDDRNDSEDVVVFHAHLLERSGSWTNLGMLTEAELADWEDESNNSEDDSNDSEEESNYWEDDYDAGMSCTCDTYDLIRNRCKCLRW